MDVDVQVREVSPRPSRSSQGQSTPNRKRSSTTNASSSDTHVLHRRPSRESTSAGGSAGDRRQSVQQRGSVASVLLTALGGLLVFLKDLASFLVRGGLSTLMFLMDQALSVVFSITSMLPGGRYLETVVRVFMWLFQLFMWIVYTALELNFYLPWKVLILYIPILAVIYIMMPKAAHKALTFMFDLVHWFLHAVKYYLYDKDDRESK